ncbi:hypothetical protein [Ancylobacter rudongensis]|uniref:Uncharacterized protein n=1 Tax=Ancylobacter rudongensis TaxID=177413 RepID=A0A1G4UPC8_9HYPH|nr:hypothetical protein [Ancylobacter rudongensis]SCW95394.1 hypothetical protein SAMN05660859_0017 [Ancylobacter rudongensis]
MHFYSPTPEPLGHAIDTHRMDGTKQWLKHYSNLLVLSFFAKNGTRKERADAEAEIIICRRKLTYWERHHNYDAAAAREGAMALKKTWEAPR